MRKLIPQIVIFASAAAAIAAIIVVIVLVVQTTGPVDQGAVEASDITGPKVRMFENATPPEGHHQYFYEYGYAVFRKQHTDETSILYTDSEPTWENGAAMLCVRNSLELSVYHEISIHPGNFCQAVPSDLTYVQQNPEHPALKIHVKY